MDGEAIADSDLAQPRHPTTAAAARVVSAGAPVLPITIRGSVVAWGLVAVAGALASVSLLQDLARFLLPASGVPHVWRLDVDAEISIPTWFASSLILLNSLLLAVMTRLEFHVGGRLRWHWLALTLIFAGLSLDETAALHNALSAVLARTLDTSGAFHFAWVIPALIACPLGLLAFIPWIADFEGRERYLLLGAAATFLAGAVGLEMLAGAHVQVFGQQTLTYRLLANVEEALEVAGMLMFLAALLAYMRRRAPRLSFEIC